MYFHHTYSSSASDHQHAFIKGRSIMDYAMIANKLSHYAKRRNEKFFGLKLDFHKASNNLDWTYLYCLSSAFSSVLVNGSPSHLFPLKRGVRQGDLISPYLFVLAVEGLKSILQKSSDLPEIFLAAAHRQRRTEVRLSNEHSLRDELQFICLTNPTWQRFKTKLAFWKASMLSLARRLVLLKSVLYSLPIYFMSFLAMPTSVQAEIESYMHKIYLERLENQNLLFKWVWKLHSSKRNSSWFGLVSSCSSITN
ncbi:uncharacterized protein LOC126657051 [Mercurialis annua]|uniref:uncharacterized protein LOC126657051 n=1 Tax=Mercurialis annua TaxID=3986 RepID=UPI002160B3D1|nr:uncharacterized protein LOC126657051 [Mercurialis annua]